MKKGSKNFKDYLMLVSSAGIVIFILLYIIATFFYAGGTPVNKNFIGFSWKENYWCNLLSEFAINGERNAARPIAMTAMIILCLSLALFWYIFPLQFKLKKMHRLAIQVPGILAMATAVLIFTELHNSIIIIAGLLGVVAMTYTFLVLRNSKWHFLFWFGVLNAVLVVINNIVYYGRVLPGWLPVIQKITFLSFLIWICLLNLKLFTLRLQRDKV